MLNHQWLTAALLPALALLTQCAHHDTEIYYSKSNQSIVKIAGDGGEEQFVRPGSALSLAIDPVAKLLIKTAGGVAHQRLDRRGYFVYPGVKNCRDLAIDPDRGHLYLLEMVPSNNGYSRIRRCNVEDGSDLTTTVPKIKSGYDLAIDTRRGKLYWTQFLKDGTTERSIWQSDHDGSNARHLYTANSPRHVTVDPVSGRLFWAAWEKNRPRSAQIWSVNPFRSGKPEPLLTGLPNKFRDLAVDPRGRKLYWTEGDYANSRYFDSSMKRCNLNGKKVETVFNFPDGRVYGTSLTTGPRLDRMESIRTENAKNPIEE